LCRLLSRFRQTAICGSRTANSVETLSTLRRTGGTRPANTEPRTKDRALADLPSDRRPAGQRVCHSGYGARGRIHLRHVRHRRRGSPDAATDLSRYLTGGGGGGRPPPQPPPPDVRPPPAVVA